MLMNWSQPMPRRRSARAAMRAGVKPKRPCRSSNTTKSFPHPCIFTNGANIAPPYSREPPRGYAGGYAAA